MVIKKEDRGLAPQSKRRFTIFHGILCEENGIKLTQADDTTLVVEHGDQSWSLNASVKDTGKRTSYVVVPTAQVRACPPLAAYLLQLPATKSRNIEVHRLVALVGLNADFTARGPE